MGAWVAAGGQSGSLLGRVPHLRTVAGGTGRSVRGRVRSDSGSCQSSNVVAVMETVVLPDFDRSSSALKAMRAGSQALICSSGGAAEGAVEGLETDTPHAVYGLPMLAMSLPKWG